MTAFVRRYRPQQCLFLAALAFLPFAFGFTPPKRHALGTNSKICMAYEDLPNEFVDTLASPVETLSSPVEALTSPSTSSQASTILDRLFSFKPVSSEMSGRELAPSLSDYVRDKAQNPIFDYSGVVMKSKENFAMIKDNWDQLGGSVSGLGESVSGLKGNFAVGGGGITEFFRSPGVQQLFEKLNVAEYGPWYLVGAAFLLSVWQNQAGENAARRVYQERLDEAEAKVKQAEVKVKQAAESASMAAQGATLAKKMASEVDMKAEEYLLEANKVKAMEAEAEKMKKELAELTAETARLRTQLKEATSKIPQAEPKPAKATPVKEVMPQIAVKNEEPILVKEKPVKGTKGVVKTAKASAKKAEKGSTKVAKKSGGAQDWTKLSVSTLKRKTVKDLSEYLTARGVEVTNGEGKPLKKVELVSAVQNL